MHLFEQLDSSPSASSRHHLRKAQLLWATLHGLAKLSSDGIFVKPEDLTEIALQVLPPLGEVGSSAIRQKIQK